jgi:hypothetical protein
MTFAEFLLSILVGWGLYRLLRPLQRSLERMLLRLLGGKGAKPVIDVTKISRNLNSGGK